MSDFLELVNVLGQFASTITFILLIASLIPKWRSFTGLGMVITSWVQGAALWINFIGITFSLWGTLATIIAALLGVGPFISAPLALLFNGEFVYCLLSIFAIILLYGQRILGNVLITSRENPDADSDKKITLFLLALIASMFIISFVIVGFFGA